MRRLFLKHFLEYLALVNSGYLFLCFTPLTYKSLNYCIYFLLFYVLIIFLYGGIFLFFDNQQYPSLRLSFDVIFTGIDKKDYCSIILSSLILLFFGMPPTRRDYPCSRGVPFNGLILQCLLFQSLLSSQMYLILFWLVIFNLIVFLFFIWTIVPFWYERKDFSFMSLPTYLNSLLGEFIIMYFSLLLLILYLYKK
jgi:NADH:ubiquinone oxidoreductase subunit 2 (subunit N)